MLQEIKGLEKVLGILNGALEDESSAKDEYAELMSLISENEGLSESERALAICVLYKIQLDERSHNALLTVLYAVIEDKLDSITSGQSGQSGESGQ